MMQCLDELMVMRNLLNEGKKIVMRQSALSIVTGSAARHGIINRVPCVVVPSVNSVSYETASSSPRTITKRGRWLAAIITIHLRNVCECFKGKCELSLRALSIVFIPLKNRVAMCDSNRQGACCLRALLVALGSFYAQTPTASRLSFSQILTIWRGQLAAVAATKPFRLVFGTAITSKNYKASKSATCQVDEASVSTATANDLFTSQRATTSKALFATITTAAPDHFAFISTFRCWLKGYQFSEALSAQIKHLPHNHSITYCHV